MNTDAVLSQTMSVPGMDADMAEIPQLESEQQAAQARASGPDRARLDKVNADFDQTLEQEKNASANRQVELQGREQMLSNLDANAPKDNIKSVMQQSPLFMALAALAGSPFKTHALTGLSSMDGMVKGMVAGDRQAYEDHWKEYERQIEMMKERFELQDQIYNEVKDSFALTREGQMHAWQIASASLGMDQADADRSYEHRKEIQQLFQKTYMQFQSQKNAREIAANRDAAMIRAHEASSTGLTPDERKALWGAVKAGKINPDKINSRTAKILAQGAEDNPNMDLNALASEGNMMRNTPFMARQFTLEQLPEVMNNMVNAGKELNYSDVKVVGAMQKWMKGELNDPKLASYMAQRNDALLTIASSMRGVGMSDQAHLAEQEANNPTMSPRALDGWLDGQMKALAPKLKIAHKFTRSNTYVPMTPNKAWNDLPAENQQKAIDLMHSDPARYAPAFKLKYGFLPDQPDADNPDDPDNPDNFDDARD